MMKSKLKKIAISFILMMAFNFILSPNILWEMGLECPHVGILFVLGLLFGPYGSLGAVLANIPIDLIAGYTPLEILPSAIISFGVSYLGSKLWYSGFKTKKITKPKLDNIYHISLFLSSILICGLIYSAAHGNMEGIIFGSKIRTYSFVTYFLNFINIAFIFGIIGIWLSQRFDFVYAPETSERQVNERLYRILFCLLMAVAIISSLSIITDVDKNIMIGEVALMGILLIAYLTKPFEYKVEKSDENTIIEGIMHNFLIITLAIAILGIIVSILSYNFITHLQNVNLYLYLMPMLIITDTIIILFFIPGILILKYIETNVLNPISSFSEIEGFIKEDEKIEAEGLVNIYSEYVNEQNEIGTLARSYTDLINHNNNYIENIRKIEGEKERINAELDIATRIQAAFLPTESIETEEYIVNGYSKPAKEVGGDFFDYYNLDDDNLVIAVGDASGKGIPAALLAMICQVIIRQMFNHENDPSKILYSLNNKLCENNPEAMFLTLWLGVYNKTTGRLTFSNAGHNPPLIKEDNQFRYLSVDSGIVLGIMEDFEYVREEITLTDGIIVYTDGITDANNANGEMYGEDRLMKFFNDFKIDDDPILYLLKDLNTFTDGTEQFDDMTLLYLLIE